MPDDLASSSSSIQLKFNNMSDQQLRQTISQLSNAATSGHYQAAFAAPTPQRSTYQKNIQNWSSSSTPPPRTGSRRSRAAKNSNLAPAPPAAAPAPAPAPTPAPAPPTPAPRAPQAPYQPPPPLQQTYPAQDPRMARPRPPLPTTTQALHSTYASRLRTGVTLLMQPILSAHAASSSAAAAATAGLAGSAARPRRGGVVSYADPGSGDDIPDAGEVDSDGSDFVASGGTRSAVRAARVGSRMGHSMNVFHAGATGSTPGPPSAAQRERDAGKMELDQSYLGMVPPARFITPKPVGPTKHENFSYDALEAQAQRTTALVPIRVEFETETHRVRDCFVWNLHEALVSPEQFARTFCADLDLPLAPWADTVAAQIRAQLEDHEGVGNMELAVDGTADGPASDEVPECRVILSIDVQVDNHHLADHIEWDLRSPLTPEAFTHQLCLDLGLSGEAGPLIAHAIHEELVKHKRDAIEWGLIGGAERDAAAAAAAANSANPANATATAAAGEDAAPRDKSGLSLMKDKTGLGLGWGRTPKDGRGPRVLRSVWRDWPEAEEFGTRWEALSVEEVERREVERERASRRLRRETSKFQSSARTRRR